MELRHKILETEVSDDLKLIVEQMIKDSINYFVKTLTVNKIEVDTHTVVTVQGWDDSDESKQHIAEYLIGVRAAAIDAAINIHAKLIKNGPRGKEILKRNVLAIIGETSLSFSEKKKTDERNPWLCEGLWHLCMAVAKQRCDIHPPGEVIGIKYVHVNAKDHGLDGLIIYNNGLKYGLSILEAKAYQNDPGRALSRAVGFFADVDNDEYSMEIFDSVEVIRLALPPSHQSHISDMFWDEERAYIVNPHYDSGVAYSWDESKEAFNKLQLKQDKLLVMPNGISNFKTFFDDISNKMREIVGGL